VIRLGTFGDFNTKLTSIRKKLPRHSRSLPQPESPKSHRGFCQDNLSIGSIAHPGNSQLCTRFVEYRCGHTAGRRPIRCRRQVQKIQGPLGFPHAEEAGLLGRSSRHRWIRTALPKNHKNHRWIVSAQEAAQMISREELSRTAARCKK